MAAFCGKGLNSMSGKALVGTVLSTKMTKSVVVQVERRFFNPLLKHYIKRRKNFMAHDELEACAKGDLVSLAPTAPRSKMKKWEVSEILREAPKMD